MTNLGFIALSALMLTPMAYGQEVIKDFDEDSIVVLNEELRLKEEKIAALESSVAALESGAAVAATQAQQETGTVTTVYASPGRQQYHQSAAKAWCVFNGQTEGTNAPTTGYNIPSIERTAEGTYTVTLGTDMSSANYCVIGITGKEGSESSPRNVQVVSMATGSFVINTLYYDGTLDDQDLITLAVFGDQ